MRRFILAILLFTLCSAVAFCQDDQEEQLPPSHAQPKLGGAIGFTPSGIYLNLDPINQVLLKSNASPLSTGPVITTGGQIYAYILIVQNLRLGGLWGSGTKTSQNVTGAIERDAELKTGYGGLTADYVFPVTQRLDFTVGTLLGGGSVNLKLTKTTGSPVTWDSTWADFGSPGPTQSYTRNLTGAFFVFQPNVSAEYAVLRWLGLRVGVGYNETIATNWREDDNYDIVGVPDNVSGRGFMINAGLFVGTFIF